jgi:hypothetical protein
MRGVGSLNTRTTLGTKYGKQIASETNEGVLEADEQQQHHLLFRLTVTDTEAVIHTHNW